MARVQFMSQLAVPPANRTRTGVTYPRVAQDSTVHDRIVSTDLYWGKDSLSSVQARGSPIEVSIVESPVDEGEATPIIGVPPPDTSPKHDEVDLHFRLLSNSPAQEYSPDLRERLKLRALDAKVPSELPSLATPCSSTDGSSRSSNSSGRSSPSSAFLEEHMQNREDEIVSCADLFEAVEEPESVLIPAVH